MKHIVASVRDAKSEAFGRPFFCPTVGIAIRSFEQEVNRPADDNMMNKYPDDFALYQLATFEDSDGTFEPIMPKILVMGDQVSNKVASIKGVSKV